MSYVLPPPARESDSRLTPGTCRAWIWPWDMSCIRPVGHWVIVVAALATAGVVCGSPCRSIHQVVVSYRPGSQWYLAVVLGQALFSYNSCIHLFSQSSVNEKSRDKFEASFCYIQMWRALHRLFTVSAETMKGLVLDAIGNSFEWGFVVLKPLRNWYLAELLASPIAFLGNITNVHGCGSSHSCVYKAWALLVRSFIWIM